MREVQPVGDLDRDPRRVGDRERSGAVDALLQRSAAEVLHDDERKTVDLTDVVYGDDAGV